MLRSENNRGYGDLGSIIVQQQEGLAQNARWGRHTPDMVDRGLVTAQQFAGSSSNPDSSLIYSESESQGH